MKISIAMTTYNGSKYLKEQLNSLLNQTRKPDEVIIFDDCSADDTANIVEKFIKVNKLDNWYFFINKENLGYKKNFYNAISNTKGDIIFLCDQDDIWHADKIKLIADIFDKNKNIKVLNTSFKYIDSKNKEINVINNTSCSNNNLIKLYVADGELIKIPFEEVCCYGISPGCTMAFRKDIKDIYLKRSNLDVVHDWEINFIASIYDSLYFLNEKTIDYRIHNSNVMGITDVNGKMSERDKLNIINRLAEAEKNYNIIKSFKSYYDLFDDNKKNILIKQFNFNKLRFNMFRYRSLYKFLNLYKYYNIYKKSNSFKGRIADLACLFLPKNF